METPIRCNRTIGNKKSKTRIAINGSFFIGSTGYFVKVINLQNEI